MKKIYALPPGENWIVDRFVDEWRTHNRQISVLEPRDAEIVWLTADWCSEKIPRHVLMSKKVVTTVHHIVPEKFGVKQKEEFLRRDAVTDVYHVPCKKTREQIESLTNKPIVSFPFWVNESVFQQKTTSKEILKEKYSLPNDKFLVGSIQRDTEGHDLKSPKLEKGPDKFVDFVISLSLIRSVHVVLAGWRRQYVIDRLKRAGVSYSYFELPPIDVITDIYSCLDLYAVTARYEGGPQSVVECASMKVPIVSTDVGLASEILAPESVGDDVMKLSPNVEYAKSRVEKLYISNGGMEPFRKLFENI